MAIQFRAEPIRSLAFGSISGTYTAIGTAFTKPIQYAEFLNLTDATLMFSYDGVVDHFVLPAGGMRVMDVGSDAVATANQFYLSIGTQIFVKQVGAPTLGAVYVSTGYAGGAS